MAWVDTSGASGSSAALGMRPVLFCLSSNSFSFKPMLASSKVTLFLNWQKIVAPAQDEEGSSTAKSDHIDGLAGNRV